MTRKSILILPALIFAAFSGCGSGGAANVSVKDILERVQSEVATIVSVEMATEATDGNNLLGKQGQYIELGWFTDSRIERNMVVESLLQANPRGTDNGGAIEKFRSTKDAQKRNEYLSKFDGAGILSSGYHEQCGVFVIRVSNKLTASQQNELAEKIKKAIK